MIHGADQARPDHDPTGPTVFMWMLVGFAVGVALLGVQALRSRTSFLIRDRDVLVEVRGLTTRRTVWDLRSSFGSYLFIATRNVSDGAGKGKSSGSITKTVGALYASDETAQRRLLIDERDDLSGIRSVAAAVSDALSLGPTELVHVNSGENLEAVHRSAHLRRLREERDRGIEDMKVAVAEMEASREELASAVASTQDSNSYAEQLETIDRTIERASTEIQDAELQSCAQDFDKYEFKSCRPGDLVKFQRMECDPSFSLRQIVALPGTIGASILIFFLTPMILPLTGEAVASLTDFVSNRRRSPAGSICACRYVQGRPESFPVDTGLDCVLRGLGLAEGRREFLAFSRPARLDKSARDDRQTSI